MLCGARPVLVLLLLAESSGLTSNDGARRSWLAAVIGQDMNKLSKREQGALIKLSGACNVTDESTPSATTVQALQKCVSALQLYRKEEEDHRKENEKANYAYAENIKTVQKLISVLEKQNKLHLDNAFSFVSSQKEEMKKLTDAVPLPPKASVAILQLEEPSMKYTLSETVPAEILASRSREFLSKPTEPTEQKLTSGTEHTPSAGSVDQVSSEQSKSSLDNSVQTSLKADADTSSSYVDVEEDTGASRYASASDDTGEEGDGSSNDDENVAEADASASEGSSEDNEEAEETDDEQST